MKTGHTVQLKVSKHSAIFKGLNNVVDKTMLDMPMPMQPPPPPPAAAQQQQQQPNYNDPHHPPPYNHRIQSNENLMYQNRPVHKQQERPASGSGQQQQPWRPPPTSRSSNNLRLQQQQQQQPPRDGARKWPDQRQSVYLTRKQPSSQQYNTGYVRPMSVQYPVSAPAPATSATAEAAMPKDVRRSRNYMNQNHNQLVNQVEARSSNDMRRVDVRPNVTNNGSCVLFYITYTTRFFNLKFVIICLKGFRSILRPRFRHFCQF